MTDIQRTIRVTIAVLALLTGGVGCGDEQPDKASASDAKKAAGGDRVETFLAGLRAFNEADLEELLTAYSEEATWHMPSSTAPLVRGRKAVARQIVAFKGLLPESTIGVRRVLESGEWIVGQAVLNGTHRWNAQGIPRPPRKVGYDMVFFVRTDAAGRAAETLVYHDQTVIRRQLGAMKGPAPAVPPWPEKVERVAEPGREDLVARAKGLLALVERGDLDGLDGLVTGSFILRDRAGGRSFSLAEVKQRLAKQRESLVDARIEVEQALAAGKYVALRFVEKATFTGGDPAATGGGSPVQFHGAHVFEFAGDRIAALETYANELELLLQIKQIKAERKAAATAKPDAGAPEN